VGFNCTAYVLSGNLVQCAASLSNVTVSTSTDGGSTFALPSFAIAKSYPQHILDKDWMAIDAANSQMYVTYTDIDNSGAVCNLTIGPIVVPLTRVAIEIVNSADGGVTWSATPTVITQFCDDATTPNASVTGSQIAIAPDGSVFVAWEAISTNPASPNTREIDIAKSAIGGTLFGTPTKVTNVNCVGNCTDGILQGGIRILELPSLVAGNGPLAGKLLVAWNDGDNPQPDALVGTYNFADVKLTISADGVTWSAPVRVNTNPASNTDHFQPAASSDSSGRVAVCFYDRRNDPNNFLIDRYCGNSTNGGASFSTNTRITSKNFPSLVSQDAIAAPGYMGDYDTLTPDTLKLTAGFRGAFANNLVGAPLVLPHRY